MYKKLFLKKTFGVILIVFLNFSQKKIAKTDVTVHVFKKIAKTVQLMSTDVWFQCRFDKDYESGVTDPKGVFVPVEWNAQRASNAANNPSTYVAGGVTTGTELPEQVIEFKLVPAKAFVVLAKSRRGRVLTLADFVFAKFKNLSSMITISHYNLLYHNYLKKSRESEIFLHTDDVPTHTDDVDRTDDVPTHVTQTMFLVNYFPTHRRS
jgi:hypothetical protein